MASDPSAGFGPLVASAQLIGLPGVLTVDHVDATASGVITPATQDRLATAAASVDGLSLAAGLLLRWQTAKKGNPRDAGRPSSPFICAIGASIAYSFQPVR